MTTPWSVEFWCEATPEHGLLFTYADGSYLELYQLAYRRKDFTSDGWERAGGAAHDNDDLFLFRKYIGPTEKDELVDFAETLLALANRVPS
jgi:hypothetical protein